MVRHMDQMPEDPPPQNAPPEDPPLLDRDGRPLGKPVLRSLTIRVDQRALTWAHLRAHFSGTSLSAVIEAYLAEYAGIQIPPRPRRRARAPSYRDYRDEARRIARGR